MRHDLEWPSAIEHLEAKLAGAGQQRPWPATWEEQPESSAARIGVAAAKLGDQAGYRRNDVLSTEAHAGGQILSHREAELFPAASTMKVYVLQALLEAVDRGAHRLDDQLRLADGDAVSGSGVCKLLTPGTGLSLLDLATLMITVSDNTATNMLIDLLGIEAVAASVTDRGWGDTHLSGKLQQAPVVAGGKRSATMTSPRDLADYFTRLWLGELLPAELTVVAQSIYRRQQFTELGRSLDYDSYSAEIGISEMVIASKSGSIRGVRNDAGVFEFGETQGEATEAYVVVVMTDGCPDRRFHADNLGTKVVGEVAALTLNELRSG